MAKMNKYDAQHWRNQSDYEKRIDEIYRTAAKEAAALGTSIRDFNPDKVFSFSDYPKTKKKIERLLSDLQSGVTTIIVNGIRSEWSLANNKNDELARQVFGDNVGKLTKELERRYFSTNGAARDAFIKRKTDGLNLSDRVWKYTDQFKEEIELGLDLGIRSGKSADELSRDLRSYLQHPDKLFRRVRNKHGQLVLSQRAKAYHPGRGVYRSSYKNARRLAATETNIAYRTADYTRWQQLDFVVGIKIVLSGNHPVVDICDDLKGRYPKDFKFTGWHPHCRCHVETILKTPEELMADNERIINGEQPTETSRNTVKDVPLAFVKWIDANRKRMAAAKSLPYFIRDNSKYVERTATATPTQLEEVLQLAEKAASVEYLAVSELKEPLREDEIIKRVGGGDKTTGSCSSLAFTYAGNKCGFDVLDFRGGNSQRFFSRTGNIMSIAEKVGGKIAKHTNDFTKAKELLKTTQRGKEYYFTCGSHAAIVRRTETGFEYLELQSAVSNGFKTLTDDVLKYRFCAKKSHTCYRQKVETRDCIIDIDLLRKDSGFKKLLGYINTAKDKQLKGASGTTK